MIAAPILAVLCAVTCLQEGGQGLDSASAEPFGRWLRTIAGLSEPSAVAVDRAGRIWIAEASADRVRAFDAEGNEVAALGSSGSGAGELLSPAGLAFAPDGSLFVADSGNHRIQRFGSDGRPQGSFGRFGSTAGELDEPRGLALDGERLYVADSRNHRIQAFDLTGRPLAVIGGRGSEEGRFERPQGIAADGEGAVYVADSGNHRVQKLDREGRYLAAWGDFGPHPGFFADPTAIACLDEKVYVADRENHRVQVFASDGELVYDFGVHALLPREGDGKLHYPDQLALAPDGSFLALVESFEDRLQLFGRWPAGQAPPLDPNRFERDQSAHYGALVSIARGHMAQVEPGAPSILVWDLRPDEPIQVTRWRFPGAGFGRLRHPIDAEIDPQSDLIHVADPGNRRIATYSFRHRGADEELRYDPFLLKLVRSLDLDALFALGSSAASRPIEPEALECAADGRLFVADVTSRSIFVFSRELELLGRLRLPGEPLLRPIDLALDTKAERLYVVDELRRSVRVFDLRSEALAPAELEPIGGPEEERGGLLRPAGIEVLADGRLWVSDRARHRLVEYGPDGRFRRALGGPGIRRVEFHKPAGIAADERGRVFVIDWGNHRGQLLSAEGEYLDSFGARFFTQPARRP